MEFLQSTTVTQCTHFLSDTKLLVARSKTTTSNQSISADENEEIALCKRHKEYFEDVEDISSEVWAWNREYDSLEVIRDKNLFMSRYSTSGQFMSTCDGCDKHLPQQRYRCLDCFDIDICEDCYLSDTRPNGHLDTHKVIELR